MATPTVISSSLNEVQGPSRTVLIAETDHATLDRLPRILSERLSHVAIEICPSVEQLARMLKSTQYAAVAMSPVLIQEYRLLTHTRIHHLLTPLIVTAGRGDRTSAETALEREAFDLIVKPLVPHQAAQTIRLALWQNKLLWLLASKERAAGRFHEHMKAFPHAVKMEQEFISKLAAFDRTFRAISTSMRRLLNIEEEHSAFDMAALVERLTKQRALDRLFHLCEKGQTQ